MPGILVVLEHFSEQDKNRLFDTVRSPVMRTMSCPVRLTRAEREKLSADLMQDLPWVHQSLWPGLLETLLERKLWRVLDAVIEILWPQARETPGTVGWRRMAMALERFDTHPETSTAELDFLRQVLEHRLDDDNWNVYLRVTNALEACDCLGAKNRAFRKRYKAYRTWLERWSSVS